MNSEKTLGQIAYEGYAANSDWKSLASGADLPQWADTKPEIREAWEAAAEAVKAEITNPQGNEQAAA